MKPVDGSGDPEESTGQDVGDFPNRIFLPPPVVPVSGPVIASGDLPWIAGLHRDVGDVEDVCSPI